MACHAHTNMNVENIYVSNPDIHIIINMHVEWRILLNQQNWISSSFSYKTQQNRMKIEHILSLPIHLWAFDCISRIILQNLAIAALFYFFSFVLPISPWIALKLNWYWGNLLFYIIFLCSWKSAGSMFTMFCFVQSHWQCTATFSNFFFETEEAKKCNRIHT